jgi:hypothetical protein
MDDAAMGKCKIDKKKSYITQSKYKHFQGGYGRLPLVSKPSLGGSIKNHLKD